MTGGRFTHQIKSEMDDKIIEAVRSYKYLEDDRKMRVREEMNKSSTKQETCNRRLCKFGFEESYVRKTGGAHDEHCSRRKSNCSKGLNDISVKFVGFTMIKLYKNYRTKHSS